MHVFAKDMAIRRGIRLCLRVEVVYFIFRCSCQPLCFWTWNVLFWYEAMLLVFFFPPEFKSMNLVLYNCAHYIKWSVPLWRIWDETPCSNWFPFLPFQTFWKILVASLIMSSLRDIACHRRRSSLNGVGYLDPFYLIWCQILISAKFGWLIIPELIF